MTWSIVARDESGSFGVAVASRFFAVGALCPHIDAAHGALSTQALVNPLYGRQGLALLAEGFAAAEVVKLLTAADAGRAQRQVHVIDAAGRAGAYTGPECVAWCGHRTGENFSVAGNMLTGPEVLDATFDAFLLRKDAPLGLRLLIALKAGEDAGGDMRGKQSAALVVHRGEDYPALDIRADDHAEPIDELFRLYSVAHERFVPFSRCLPTRENLAGLTDRAAIDAAVDAWLAVYAAGGERGTV